MRLSLREKQLSFMRKIGALLTPEERRALAILLLLMIIASMLEALSVGSVMSLLAVLGSGGISGGAHAPLGFFRRIEGLTRDRQIVAAMVLMAVVYLMKNLFIAFASWRQVRFGQELSTSLGQRLFSLYLRQPYAFYLRRNSAHLINNIGIEVLVFSGDVMLSALVLTSECLVLLALGLFLLIAEPLSAVLIALSAAVVIWAFHYLTHEHATRFGADRQYHEERAYQHLQQGIGAAKEIILLGREPEFLAQYFSHNTRRANATARHEVLRLIPRLALEMFAVLLMVVLTGVMLARGRPVSSIVPALALFAAVAFRVLPSVTRILYSLHTLRYGAPTADRLYDEFASLAAANIEESPESVALDEDIRLEDVSYSYAASAEPTLTGVSVRVSRGESVGIIGPSGAGKSTLIDVLLGLLTPGSGTVCVDGQDIQRNLRGWQNQIGYVPQIIYITDDSIRRNVAFGVSDDQIDEGAVWRALGDAQLAAFVRGLPDGLDTLLGDRGIRISGGERQRVGIARALYQQPSVLVLDEATSALDLENERGVVNAVRALKGMKTIIIVTHRASTIEHCDRVYRLHSGTVVDGGTSRDLLMQQEIGQ